MRNKRNQDNMCDVTRDLQTLPFCKLSHFIRHSPSPAITGAFRTLCTTVKHLKSAIQWFRGALELNYSAHEGCYNPMHELCLCWPLILELSSTLPAPGITIPLTAGSSRRDDLRMSCLLA